MKVIKHEESPGITEKRRRLMAGRREPMESAAENNRQWLPSGSTGKGEKVSVRAHRGSGNRKPDKVNPAGCKTK